MNDTETDDTEIDNEVGLSALTDPKARKAIRDCFAEIGVQLDAQEEARDNINDILDASASKFNLKKPLLRKVAKMYWKRNGQEFKAQASEINDLYNQVTTV
jgi:hypothetical protein